MTEVRHGSSSAYTWHKCRCDVCVTAKRERDHDYYLRNTEKLKAQTKTYYAGNRERALAQRKQYREANNEAIKRQKAEANRKNPEPNRRRAREWKKANPERAHANERRWKQAYSKTPKGLLEGRLAMAARRASVPKDQKQAVKEYCEILLGDPCSYCGNPATEIDHIVAINRGGLGDPSNLTAACRSCNSKKYNLSLLAYLVGTTRRDRSSAERRDLPLSAPLTLIERTNA